MRKLLFLLALLLPSPALAGVSCSVPFNLQNGTTADASQVMANYNALIACLANAAASGANSDITALNGLTTPIAPTVGGTPVFFAGTSTGSGTTYAINPTTPSNFSLTQNYIVIFTAGFTSTGAATLSVNGGPATPIVKQIASGPAIAAGDIVVGNLVMAAYDGTNFQLLNPGSVVAASASLIATNQTLSGGANVTSNYLGSLSGGGSLTINCGLGPLQFFVNAGNYTLAAPATDGSCIIGMSNGGSAGAISFSGFTVGGNTGEPLTTTNGNKFFITVVEIGGVATYFVKALQ